MALSQPAPATDRNGAQHVTACIQSFRSRCHLWSLARVGTARAAEKRRAAAAKRCLSRTERQPFSRAAVASLAGEFQLARSTAVLAETLGKLMNLPRRDGEAVETYVGRLTEALRALPPAQRLALEQQIGKALQGLSLSMLAEILKQPTGPDAARLALLIELSRYRGRSGCEGGGLLLSAE